MAKSSGLSQSAVVRIWRAFGLQPHRAETFKLSTDHTLARAQSSLPETIDRRVGRQAFDGLRQPGRAHSYMEPVENRFAKFAEFTLRLTHFRPTVAHAGMVSGYRKVRPT